MKRFTLTLSLLLAFAVTAVAQKYIVRESVADVQSGYYVVMAASNINNEATASTGPVQYSTSYTDESSVKYRMDVDKAINVGDVLTDGNYIWKIENNGTTITLKNLQDGVYFVKDVERNKNFTGTETANLILEKVSSSDSDKRFYLTLQDASIGYIHCNDRSQDPCLSYWDSKAETGSCVRFEFYPAEEYIDLYEPFSTGSRSTGASHANYASRKITAVTVNGTTVSNTGQEQLYVDLTSSSFTVAAGADVQVTLEHNSIVWMHSYVYVDFDSDGFKYVEGDAVPLGDLVSYSFKHTDADGTVADIGHNSNNKTVKGDTVINKIPSFKAPVKHGTYRMRYKMAWDDFDPAGNTAWVSDAGTIIDFTLVVEPAQAEAAELRTLLDILKVYCDGGLLGEHTGQYSSSEFDDVVAIYTAGEAFYSNITYETAVDAINTQITTINNLINSLELNMPKSGAVYAFKSVDRGWWASGTSSYLYSTGASGASVTTANANVDNAACQWVVYQGGKGMYIYNIAAGKFITLGDSDNNVPLAELPNNSTLEFKSSTADGHPYLVGLNNKAINLNITNTGNFPYGSCLWSDGWTSDEWSSDPGSAVKITYIKDADEATLDEIAKRVSIFEDAPYTLSVGATGYASLYLGFDAAIPNDVEAYIVTNTDAGYVHLDRVTGTLPAKTGVVIKAAANTLYEFVVSAGAETIVEGGSSVEDNLLCGTTQDSYIYEDAYVLSAPGGVVAFHLAAMNQEQGTAFTNYKNRIYMPKSVLSVAAQGSASFRFVFGTTGVEEVETESGNVKVIYDLTGRCVEAVTAPGIYIVNGKKVLVK